jgi:hypothetical protein
MGNAAMSPKLPEDVRTSEGHRACLETLRVVSIAESLRHRNGIGEDKSQADALVSPWFDRACAVYMAQMSTATEEVKAEHLAARMGVDEHYLSHMRAGRKPVALRHLIAFMDCPAAIAALEEGINSEAGLDPPRVAEEIKVTDEDLQVTALEVVRESSALRREVAIRIAERKRVAVDRVLNLLR